MKGTRPLTSLPMEATRPDGGGGGGDPRAFAGRWQVPVSLRPEVCEHSLEEPRGVAGGLDSGCRRTRLVAPRAPLARTPPGQGHQPAPPQPRMGSLRCVCPGATPAWSGHHYHSSCVFFSLVIYFSVRKECGEFTTGCWLSFFGC